MSERIIYQSEVTLYMPLTESLSTLGNSKNLSINIGILAIKLPTLGYFSQHRGSVVFKRHTLVTLNSAEGQNNKVTKINLNIDHTGRPYITQYVTFRYLFHITSIRLRLYVMFLMFK